MFRKIFSKSSLISLLIVSMMIAASLGVALNRQRIIDQITVWQFNPTAEVVALVDDAGMSDNGKFFYLASQPVLDATQNFNTVCESVENTMSILGCYTNNRIYVYNVRDKNLDGIREVTAAHEALHAAYSRLSQKEKERIGILLEAEYIKIENDISYSDRMDFYARTEPGERINELHSVIGTEVSDISVELEEYYSQYFEDRQKVVRLYQKYSKVFQDLKDKSISLANRLNELSKSINHLVNTYNTDVIRLNSDIETFNRMSGDGSFGSQSEFNAARAVLVERVSVLDALRVKVNNDIAEYGRLLVQYNSNAAETKRIYNSIDSTLAPAPSV